MEPKKSFATTESPSVGGASFDLESPVGPRAMPPPDRSANSRRRSQSSLQSESDPQAPSPCAIRETPEGDCALQRFIVWAAIKRNKSVRMAASERLKCPLLLCGERFNDHEAMLRHLIKCQHLRTGEYVCYDCMKIERFDDGKCRCCLGHPTKRRRIINMAKNFFSSIGNRSRRGEFRPNRREDVPMPPPSYESLMVDVDDSEQRQPQCLARPQLELNGREIHELDSRQMLPTAELDSINYDAQPIDMPMALGHYDSVPEVIVNPQTNLFSKNGEIPTQNPDKDGPMLPLKPIFESPGGNRPSLALDTHMDRYRNVPRTKYLSPSSSLRSTRSPHNVSPVTPWSAGSGSSGAFTMGSNIDTAMTTPITPISPNDLLPVPQHEDILTTEKATTTCPDDGCNYTADNMPELPGDDPRSVPRGLSDPLFFPYDPKDNFSWIQSVSTELSLATSVNMMFTDSNTKATSVGSGFLETPISGSEAKTLVESAWDALQEHISTSLMKLDHIKGNPLAERLQTQSSKSVALTGLSSLKSILQGNDLTDPLDYICFIHIIYAFSLIVHGDNVVDRSDLLYQQALAYQRFLDPAHLEDYTQIVTTVWQPTSGEQHQVQIGIPQSDSSHYKGKEREYQADSRINAETDPLIMVGQNFLDDLENSVITSDSQKPDEVLTSELWSTHLGEFQPETLHNIAFTITADYIIRVLRSNFHGSDMLLSKLGEIGQKVHAGYITTVRKLELAILQIGKVCLVSSDLFDKYIPQVRRLCDPIYSEQGSHSRIRYQILGVSLVEALVQTITPNSQGASEESALFPYNEFLENLHETFEDPSGLEDEFLVHLDTSASQQNQTELGSAQNFGPAVDPISFQDIGSSAPASTTASRSLTTTASHTGTPRESFSASPDLSRPAALPTPPKPATPAHAEASERPISSTGPKVEANDSCEFCGYRPKGDPQWFKGSMAKHKKMQHSTGPPIIYKCPYPGCNSQYKNRQDNLRQHQIEKNHFVGDEATRRPSKRKKISTD
ncbi:hypothetical protein AAE478_001878 [Parahypoxylon ruwenzoriense]